MQPAVTTRLRWAREVYLTPVSRRAASHAEGAEPLLGWPLEKAGPCWSPRGLGSFSCLTRWDPAEQEIYREMQVEWCLLGNPILMSVTC